MMKQWSIRKDFKVDTQKPMAKLHCLFEKNRFSGIPCPYARLPFPKLSTEHSHLWEYFKLPYSSPLQITLFLIFHTKREETKLERPAIEGGHYIAHLACINTFFL